VNSDQQVNIVCVWVNGNSNITNVKINSPVSAVYFGINGNVNEINVTIAEGVKVDAAYSYLDGENATVEITQMVAAAPEE